MQHMQELFATVLANLSTARSSRPMSPRHRLTPSLSLEARQLLAALSFTPSNFSAEVGKVKKGDTVSFAVGNYKVSGAAQNALENATSLTGVEGSTTLDFSGESSLQFLNIDGANNGKISGLKFLNAGIVVKNSNGFTIQDSSFDGYSGKSTSGDTRGLVSFYSSNNSSIRNIDIHWNNTSENVRAVAFRDSNNITFSDNQISGRLKQGAIFNGVNNGTIANNTITRVSGTPGSGQGQHSAHGEDHGIYILNVNNMTVQKNTVSGWSKEASGHSLKIKDGSNHVVSDNLFKSGILVRTNKNSPNHQNLRITNNRITDGSINIWTPGVLPTSVRLEGNQVPKGAITVADGDPRAFNQNGGGVFHNVAKSFSLLKGINNSGNQTA
jgi:hypothetical protein